MIKVGCFKKSKSEPGFTNVEAVSVSKSGFKVFSPFFLHDEDDIIFENYWQFHKVYEEVPDIDIIKDGESIWKHSKEKHIENGELTSNYFKWREKGMKCQEPLRYPVGKNYASKCKFALQYDKKLNYIQSRKEIYLKKYCELAKKIPLFDYLKKQLKAKKNLLILDFDGPHQNSLAYYKEKYNVDDNFISNHAMEINQKNINIMINDPKHPFGHGYCLALALLGKEEWAQ